VWVGSILGEKRERKKLKDMKKNGRIGLLGFVLGRRYASGR
jgi:hypothetical protein